MNPADKYFAKRMMMFGVFLFVFWILCQMIDCVRYYAR
jgi:hypothetical protein